jgi:phage tail sheath gpL-like
MADIPITGYPSSHRAPFSAVELLFGQGASNAPSGPRTAVYVGPKTSAGTATVNTVYNIRNEKTAADLFGVGSPLHRLVRLHFQSYKLGKVSAVCYAASSGGGVATATATITVGGSATAAGLLKVWICGEPFTVSYKTSGTPSTPTQIGDALAAQINGKTWLPLTAANVTGTVTLTAKIAGASQGDGTVGVYRVRAEVQPGTGITVATSGAALGLGSGTAGADGATTENTGLTNALAVLDARRDYYMGFSVWSATHLATIKTHVNTKSLPNPGLRSAAWSGYTHTLAACSTVAIGVNHERMHIGLQTNSEHDPAEICAQLVAVHQAEEAIRGGFVKDNYAGAKANWLLKPCATDTDWPDDTDINDAVVDGISIIASSQTGSKLVMSVNTRSKDSGGTLDDFRATERHRISFLDDFADTWLLRDQLTWNGFKLTDDKRLPDGSIDFNQDLPDRVVTPSRYKSWFSNLITEFSKDGVLQRPDEWKDSLAVQIDPDNISRIEIGASGRTYDLAHQRTCRLSETTPG